MTKEEIRALIAAKIAGQGSMVDIGGALPAILDALLDVMPAESLLWEGVYTQPEDDDPTLVANPGTATNAQLRAAYAAGTPVRAKIKFVDETDSTFRYEVFWLTLKFDDNGNYWFDIDQCQYSF